MQKFAPGPSVASKKVLWA